MHIDALDQVAAGGAALVAGAVNALAGGGSLISFPTLVGLGVPAVAANVTNTVSLVPGYLSGSWAQRGDLQPQLQHARILTVAAVLGGLGGSILLIALPGHAFRLAVPYLILVACGLLAFGKRLRPKQSRNRPVALGVSVFFCSVYGGFFGAGLGIMVLAVLGLFRAEPLTKLNSLKQALQLVTNAVAAAFFVFSGRTVWALIPVMAVGSLAGGTIGGRLVQVVDGDALRWIVVAAGLAVAVSFLVA